MENKIYENGRGIGSVKAAISRFGGMLNQGIDLRKDASDFKEKESKVKKTFGKFKKTQNVTKTVETQTELHVLNAEKCIRELTSQIEELKLKGNDQSTEEFFQMENRLYMNVMRELEILKQEVSKIKLDMVRALEEKCRAQKEENAASLRLRSYMITAEKLRSEINEADEEEVLVELARIQAIKELDVIEAQKKEEEGIFLCKIQEARNRIIVLRNELMQEKQIKDALEIMNSEIAVLQNEMSLIKENDETMARKEQESIKEELFQIMTSMDSIRIELNDILGEKGQIERVGAKTDKYIKKLNMKLLRAKDKLEAAKSSQQKARLMLPSFTLSLQELQRVKKEALDEQKSIIEETTRVRDDIQKTESMTDYTENRLWFVMKELEEVKIAEVDALQNLEIRVQNAVIARAKNNADSSITVSKSEYDYLIGCAMGVDEVADKKVAAAHAWVEALRASAREMETRTEFLESEIKGMKMKDEQELYAMERMEPLLNGDALGKLELKKCRAMAENSYSLIPVKPAKFRKSSGSTAARRPIISTFWTVNRKRKVMSIGQNCKYPANE